MDDGIKLQLLNKIVFLINDDIGMLYDVTMWEHSFKMIFNNSLIEIGLSQDLIDIDISIHKNSSVNRIGFVSGDAGVNELISLLKGKFLLDDGEHIKEFIDEVDVYINGGDIKEINEEKGGKYSSQLKNLNLKLNNYIKTEQFEKAEEIEKKIFNIKNKK
jgi:ribosome-associated protein YbcJ (S4-like RNA binding protein)